MKKLLLLTLVLMWGCTETPEHAAKEACDCKRAELEIGLAGDEAAKVKLSQIASKKADDFRQSHPDLQSDKEFWAAYQKELSKCYKELEKEFEVVIK